MAPLADDGWRFSDEDDRSTHPGDAAHWASAYAELLRSVPPELKGSLLEARFRARVEFWEERLRELSAASPHLAGRRPPTHAVRTRRSPRTTATD